MNTWMPMEFLMKIVLCLINIGLNTCLSMGCMSCRVSMMTSSNGNLFLVTGHLCGEFTGHRWIPRPKGQRRGALMFSFICARINGWVNNREAGDSRRYRGHYDVTVMKHKDPFFGMPSSCIRAAPHARGPDQPSHDYLPYVYISFGKISMSAFWMRAVSYFLVTRNEILWMTYTLSL